MLERFFKSQIATVSDPDRCNHITDALAAAGIKFYCKTKDVNQRNAFDQARIGTLGIKPKYITAISLKTQNNNDDKLKFCVLRGLLHHNYTIL